MMLAPKQEKLLAHLRKQLDIYANVGILSKDQQKDFAKLAAAHDKANQLTNETIPQNDKTFEIESKRAFPAKVTPEDLHAESFNTCRIKMGFSPVLPFRKSRRALEEEMKRLTTDGWDVMPSQLNFGDDDQNSTINGDSQNINNDNDIIGNNNDDLPSLYEIIDPPTNADDLTEYIQKVQSERCGQCNKKIERTRLGLGTYKARWCHEMNRFCCEACNNGTIKSVLPSYAILRWDFEPKIVRSAYGADAEFQYSKPSLIPSAENPLLFEQVPILQDLRRLRFQLSKLYDIGQLCPDFMKSLTQEPERLVLGTLVLQPTQSSSSNHHQSSSSSAAASSARKASFFINERQRYLIQDSELWSLSDLEQVHRTCPQKMPPGPTAIQQSREMLQKSQFAKFLQSIRDSMIRHVLSECKDCKLRAAHNCLECGAEHPIYCFDVRNCYECARCHSVFHRKCWEGIQKNDESCPGCVDLKTTRQQEG